MEAMNGQRGERGNAGDGRWAEATRRKDRVFKVCFNLFFVPTAYTAAVTATGAYSSSTKTLSLWSSPGAQ